ncbi:unnamed protein product [Coccothraustes coccothraustes]
MAELLLAVRERLLFQATCSICLELFREPVLTACGHSFCGQCLAGVLGDPPSRSRCPQCRAPVEPGSLRPNRSLGDVAEVVRSLEEVGSGPRCPQHGKPLALFCEPCAALLCALCRDGPEHRRHRVRPAEEAARELRKKLRRNMHFLQKQKKKLKRKGDQKSEDLLMTVMLDNNWVRKMFEKVQKILLFQLKIMALQSIRNRKEYMFRIRKRQSLLDSVIAQIEEKLDQPAVEFLKVRQHQPLGTEAVSGCAQLSRGAVHDFSWHLGMVRRAFAEQVTLDPQTANDFLILSRDRKRVWLGDEEQNLPGTSKRFTCSLSVLGTQGFTSGRHYWEVDVGEEGCWAVGVALESVLRKEPLDLHRSEKVWALRVDWRGQYSTICMTSEVLALRGKLQRIRVCLEYEAGRVTFYNANDMTQILQFEATFTEEVFPYFCVYSKKTQIRVCD